MGYIQQTPWRGVHVLLGFAAVPTTQAADLPSLPVDLAVQPALMECGCMCPYVGAGVQIEAAGQERGAFVVASCQSGYGTTTGPADGGEPVQVFPIVGGGGLDLAFT